MTSARAGGGEGRAAETGKVGSGREGLIKQQGLGIGMGAASPRPGRLLRLSQRPQRRRAEHPGAGSECRSGALQDWQPGAW
eukprot:366440-Chlamydomonas_euryale.AAC.7